MIEKKLPWVVAAVLAALLIIMTFLWLDARSSLENGNLTAQRDIIREHCTKTDDESRELCQKELEDLSVMLTEFVKTQRAADLPEAQVEIATSTATTTGQ